MRYLLTIFISIAVGCLFTLSNVIGAGVILLSVFLILLIRSDNKELFLYQLMVLTFFFCPFQYLTFLNPGKILNPLILCGCGILLLMLSKERLNIFSDKIDKF